MPSTFEMPLESGNEIGFAFECEIYFNERHGSSLMLASPSALDLLSSKS